MNSKFLITVIFILLGINVFLLTNFHLYRKNCTKSLATLSQDTDKLITHRTNLITGIENNNIILKNILVKDSLNNILPLDSIFFNGQDYILICRFSEINCESCINYSINSLLQYCDSIGKNNILFLGAYRNNKTFNKQKYLYGLKTFNTLNTNELPLPAENLGYPYYIVVNKSLQIQHIFVPSKRTPSSDSEYLNLICKKYFKPKCNKEVLANIK